MTKTFHRLRRPKKISKRGYALAYKGGRHVVSATVEVLSIDRREGTFDVEADGAMLGPRRVEHEQGSIFLEMTVPLIELRPADRRRLVVHQALMLRANVNPKDKVVRRWKANYWKPVDIARIHQDAENLRARFRSLAPDPTVP